MGFGEVNDVITHCLCSETGVVTCMLLDKLCNCESTDREGDSVEPLNFSSNVLLARDGAKTVKWKMRSRLDFTNPHGQFIQI